MRIAALKNRQRGDTIIEVMFAFAVFAAVAVGSMSIMNRSSAIAQRSLEITQVRAQMDAQADAIRFVHRQYTSNYPAANAEWTKLMNKGQSSASTFGLGASTTSCPAISGSGRKPFIMNAQQAVVNVAVPAVDAPVDGTMPPYAQVIYNDDGSINQAYGIWVEAVPDVPTVPGVKKPGYVDFHIRACWPAAGSPVPMTLGTIVRLYVPL